MAKVITIRDDPAVMSERDLFVTETGGFDTHQDLEGTNAGLFAGYDLAINEFANEMKAQGIWNSVTVVTVSEFGRTLTSNGLGTDHAWGGHHTVLGGGISGGQILGNYPEDLTEAPTSLNIGRGR